MLAKYHPSVMDPSPGDIALISDVTDSNKDTLVSGSGSNMRFIVVAGGVAGTATTLVMWLKGESF